MSNLFSYNALFCRGKSESYFLLIYLVLCSVLGAYPHTFRKEETRYLPCNPTSSLYQIAGQYRVWCYMYYQYYFTSFRITLEAILYDYSQFTKRWHMTLIFKIFIRSLQKHNLWRLILPRYLYTFPHQLAVFFQLTIENRFYYHQRKHRSYMQ